jgi:TonB family protein
VTRLRPGFRLASLGAVLSAILALPLAAQTSGAVETKHVDPVYPENLLKTQEQGNVLLIGRIDAEGRVRDLTVVASTNKDFEPAALEAVRQWLFRPATRDGKRVEIFTNVAVRFRIKNERRGEIPQPILGDLAVSPADASGKATAPEGFPIQRGKDPALHAEAVIDVPPSPETRTLAVRVEALSPSGKKIPVFQPPVSVPARATEVKVPVVVRIGDQWEEGVWGLLFQVDGKGAGGGQFWLASDPSRFPFLGRKP